jgi:hypothetical protein
MGKSIALACFGTSIQFGCIFQSFFQICSPFLVILLSFILLSQQVFMSVRLTNFILTVADLVVSFTHATIRRSTRPCKKICHCARQKGIWGVEVQLNSILTAALVGIRILFHAPATVPRGKNPRYLLNRWLNGPMSGIKRRFLDCPTRPSLVIVLTMLLP